MQKELSDLVEAVRNGRGMNKAMLAAQVSLLLANNPGKSTLHDPATAGPDDLARRLVATAQSCGDAAIAPSAYTWPEVESICKAVILAIVAVGDKRVPADLSAPNGCSTHCECLAGCTCEHCCAPADWLTVLINGKQYTLAENARPRNDAEVADLARIWGVTASQINTALGRLPATPKPVMPATVLMPQGSAWHNYPQDPPKIPGMYHVRLMSGEETWRNTAEGSTPCGFLEALDPMNTVVEWYG